MSLRRGRCVRPYEKGSDWDHSKLADWDDDDPSAIKDVSSRWDKVVILKHMFTLEELEVSGDVPLPSMSLPRNSVSISHPNTIQEDPAAMLDIKEDIREECAKLGEVTNVVLFDKEPDGVASVRYSSPEAANACVKVRSIVHTFRPLSSVLIHTPSITCFPIPPPIPSSPPPQFTPLHPTPPKITSSNRS